MNVLKNLVSNLLEAVATPMLLVVNAYARLRCYQRGGHIKCESRTGEFVVEDIAFKEESVDLAGFSHRITIAGDASSKEEDTIVLMGGIPTDSSETFYWLVARLCNLNVKLRCVIVHLPFMEMEAQLNYSETIRSSYVGRALPFNQEVSLSKMSIDPRYDHRNQAKTTFEILQSMNIHRAHFVGHDRGAVVFDYLIGENPRLAISYSRGAQLWDYYDDDWSNLAPSLIVGPPHRQMTLPWQLQLLFFLVIVLKRPINLLSPSFTRDVSKSLPGTDAYDRATHLFYKTLAVPKSMKLKIQQIMMQTDSTDEVRRRNQIKQCSVPIMQFQGEDEFAYDGKNNLVSDQPFFGIYNLFVNEICDLYPGCVGQKPEFKKSEFLFDHGDYFTVKLLKKARLNRFCLIPNAAHFNIIENPGACAGAINDFIKSV